MSCRTITKWFSGAELRYTLLGRKIPRARITQSCTENCWVEKNRRHYQLIIHMLPRPLLSATSVAYSKHRHCNRLRSVPAGRLVFFSTVFGFNLNCVYKLHSKRRSYRETGTIVYEKFPKTTRKASESISLKSNQARMYVHLIHISIVSR